MVEFDHVTTQPQRHYKSAMTATAANRIHTGSRGQESMITVVSMSYGAQVTAVERPRSFCRRDFQICLDFEIRNGMTNERQLSLASPRTPIRLFSPPESSSGSLQAAFLFSFRSQTT
jgi:hypothetical protein